MSAAEVDDIVDNTIRELVKAKLAQIGSTPDKVFADPGNHPYITAKDGRHIFIHSARIRDPIAVISLGNSSCPRFAAPGSNHHMEIFAVLDQQGKEKKWEAKTVNLMGAAQRVRAGTPVIQRDHGPNTQFRFSLSGGEHLELDDDNGNRRLVRITVISGKKVEFRLHTDARPNKLMRDKEKGGRAGLSLAADSLRKAKARKVVVDPLGNILPAND